MDAEFPRAPDVAKRETDDDGSSAGWGGHFLPAEEYVIDCHMHVSEKEPWLVHRALDTLFATLDAYRLDQILVMDGGPGSTSVYSKVAKADRRFSFLIWMKPDRPDLDFLRRAHKAGAKGIKLHNFQIYGGRFDWKVWESPEWAAVFAEAEKLKMPILWHVTQEATGAPYMGEGSRGPFKGEREPGRPLTNTDLLEQLLGIVDRHQGITFVGAHMLYVGNTKLDELFAAHENLAVDTSCGGFLRFGDQMLDEDVRAGREFFIKWPDRLLFGTDNRLSAAHCNEQTFEAFRCHLRYIRALRLPDDVLQKVMWQNAKRIFNMNGGDGTMKATTRP